MPFTSTQIDLLRQALREDIGKGDVTSNLLIPSAAKARAVIVAKEAGVFAGAEVVRALFRIADPKIQVRLRKKDGQVFSKKRILIELNGSVRSLLKVERTALNFLQHLCGIATLTRQFVQRVKPWKVKILDTRKTTPLWRFLVKAAVKAGGGVNHRRGLYDAVFVKENHRVYGDLRKLIRRGEACLAPTFEIEVRNIKEALQAAAMRPDVILFDNFSPVQLRKAVSKIRRLNSKIILEASGGVTLGNVAAFARSGVDQISIGALTHSAPSINLSLSIK